MKNLLKIIIIVLIIVSGLIFYFLKEPEAIEKTLEYDREREKIQILDKNDNLILEYSIKEFNEWTKENWDIFEEPPQVGMREVIPGNFGWFDNTASLSPDFEKFVFSVHDYAVATYTSFIGIMDIRKEEVSLVKDPAPGGIEQLVWSSDSNYLAYTLGTGRAQGDYLGVSNTKTLEQEFILSEEDVGITMPRFEGLYWKEEKLFFTTNNIRWSINKNGTNLEKKSIKEEFSEEGILIINNPGLELETWYLSYEKQGSPGLKKQIKLKDFDCLASDRICTNFYEKNKNLTGSRVRVSGLIEDGVLNLSKIEFKEKTLEEIVISFLGAPYQRGPLGEKEDELLYRTDVFDCTTLVLISVSNLLVNDLSPEEMIEKVNYFPQGQVSYETRLHYSTYRNQVLDFFQDISQEIAPELYQEKQIILNKDRLIDIDWEKEITLNYIKKQDVANIIAKLPSVLVVGFLVHGDEEIGLDIRHEGFLFNRTNFIHASAKTGKVIQENFLNFLHDSNYDGVTFFKVNEN